MEIDKADNEMKKSLYYTAPVITMAMLSIRYEMLCFSKLLNSINKLE